MSGNKWVYVRETLKEILNSNSFNCFVDLEWHFGRALTCLHFHRGKSDLNDLQHHGSPCFVPRSLSGTGTLLRQSPLVINRCNRANVFLQHNSAIVFNAWLSFWHTCSIHKYPYFTIFSIPIYDQLVHSNLSFPQTSNPNTQTMFLRIKWVKKKKKSYLHFYGFVENGSRGRKQMPNIHIHNQWFPLTWSWLDSG